MCNMEKNYAAFATLLNSSDFIRERDFRKLCGRLQISASSLDEVLFEELGKSGQEIMDEYFGNEGDF